MDYINTLQSGSTISGTFIGGTTVSWTCGLPTCSGYWHYNYPTTNVIITNYTQSSSDFEIRKVANGFIVKRNYNEYVFETVENMLKFIRQESKNK